MTQCNAKTLRNTRCKKKAVEGSLFCALHGEVVLDDPIVEVLRKEPSQKPPVPPVDRLADVVSIERFFGRKPKGRKVKRQKRGA